MVLDHGCQCLYNSRCMAADTSNRRYTIGCHSVQKDHQQTELLQNLLLAIGGGIFANFLDQRLRLVSSDISGSACLVSTQRVPCQLQQDMVLSDCKSLIDRGTFVAIHGCYYQLIWFLKRIELK